MVVAVLLRLTCLALLCNPRPGLCGLLRLVALILGSETWEVGGEHELAKSPTVRVCVRLLLHQHLSLGGCGNAGSATPANGHHHHAGYRQQVECYALNA
jgi:hypothetical protein